MQDGGDVGVIETVLVLGAQSGGAQGRTKCVLRLPPERKRQTTENPTAMTQFLQLPSAAAQ